MPENLPTPQALTELAPLITACDGFERVIAALQEGQEGGDV